MEAIKAPEDVFNWRAEEQTKLQELRARVVAERGKNGVVYPIQLEHGRTYIKRFRVPEALRDALAGIRRGVSRAWESATRHI